MRFKSAVYLLAALAVVLPGVRAVLGFGSPAPAEALLVGFGAAVVVGDGEVLVGEAANNFRPGAVYVYRKVDGVWQQAAVLNGPEPAVYDRFGSALALDGDRLFVGAGPAAVHVFERRGADWTLASTIGANEVAAEDVQFGNALAASGDWLLVGKVVASGGRGGRGAAPTLPPGEVYVFRRSGPGQFAYHTTLRSPATQRAGDAFGASVAMAGNLALVGAPGTAGRAGVVHEFAVNEAGEWTWERDFAPRGIVEADAFGALLALDGERAVVAAPGEGAGHGALYVMLRVQQAGRGGGPGGAPQVNISWQELLRLNAPASRSGDGFGSSLAMDGREIWVGAPSLIGGGGVYVFEVARDGYSPDGVALLRPDVSTAGIGRSVSIRGDIAAVGVTVGSPTLREGVVIYERSAAGEWIPQPMLSPALDELAPLTGNDRRCSTEGKVGEFDCSGIVLHAFLPPSSLTHDGHYMQMNDVWGWTDPVTGKEWVIAGRRDGTTFVDITDPRNPVPVADLPLTPGATPASWRDMKVYRDHAYIVADGAGPHGMQVFDLTRLSDLAPVNGRAVLVEPDLVYREINSAHNIVINEESGFAYSVGSSAGGQTCAGGLHMIDIREPKNPKFAGCFAHAGTGRANGGYTHDAQCVTYRGPDVRYRGREICLGANENAISIADVTDKANPRPIATATYPNFGYAHQGWFTEDQRYWFMDDESDEGPNVPRTRTMIWDLSDLENPRLAKEHMGVESTYDHNLYIKGNLMYQANYRSGLRILDISDPLNPFEVAHIDTAPYTPNTTGFNGAWSVYPFFESGAIVVTSIEQGLFIVQYRELVP